MTLTSTNEVEKSFVQMGGGLDTAKITADIDNTTVAGGAGSDSIHVIGGFNSSSLFGGKGNDVIRAIVGGNTSSSSLIQTSTGTNTIEALATVLSKASP